MGAGDSARSTLSDRGDADGDSAAPLRPGLLLAGRYEVVALLGKGASASVYQVYDRITEQHVAVKALDPEKSASTTWVERLARELRHARGIQHPHVCRVHDFFESQGRCFLTMELASGGTLGERLSATRHAGSTNEGATESGTAVAAVEPRIRPWPARIADARAVILGLAAIHGAGIVHRDVKPANVLVMADGRLVVTDFGVSVALGSSTYFSTQTAGTPLYMAPEISMGAKATLTSDVFSLGIVLHEIFFHRRPEWGDVRGRRMLRSPIAGDAPSSVSALYRLCAECLEESPPHRLSDAAVVRERFDRAARGTLPPLRPRARPGRLIALLAVAVTVASATLIATRHLWSRSDRGPTATGALSVTGTPTDLAPLSRAVFATDKAIMCMMPLGGNRVRVIQRKPAEAIDIDLATGQGRPVSIVNEAIKWGCPAASRDGRRLLYETYEGGGHSSIMLSSRPDGGNAVKLVAGTEPKWFPSEDQILFHNEAKRAAVFSLSTGLTQAFPETAPFEKGLAYDTIRKDGRQVALVFMDAGIVSILELYDYPSMKLLRTEKSRPGLLLAFPYFDDVRKTLQVSIVESRVAIRGELVFGPVIARLFALAGTSVVDTLRVPLGVVFRMFRGSYSVVVTAPDGQQREYFHEGGWQPSLNAEGDALFPMWLDDGRLVVALQGFHEQRPHILTRGPLDGGPAFLRGGDAFTYIRQPDQAIVRCELTAGQARQCQVIHQDPLGPTEAASSPDGVRIAYSTTFGPRNLLRVVTLSTGEVTDLGRNDITCALRWSSSTHLWTYEPQPGQWVELDVISRARTGRIVSAPPSQGNEGSPCDIFPPGTNDGPGFTVRSLTGHTSEIRLSRNL
jgi:eukaryotic-like serine/threonine-protein kinase